MHSHSHVAENAAWLRMGFHFFLMFLNHHLEYGDPYAAQTEEQFKEMLYRIACRQSDAIDQDIPTHLFLRKLFALPESKQAYLKNRESLAPDKFQPGICVGCFDNARVYFFADLAHRLLRKLFTILWCVLPQCPREYYCRQVRELYDRQEHAGQPAATISCGKNVAQLLQRPFAEGRDHYRSTVQKDAGNDYQQKIHYA